MEVELAFESFITGNYGCFEFDVSPVLWWSARCFQVAAASLLFYAK